MTERIFVDTNVFIYARDDREPAKQSEARAWLRALGDRGSAVTSPQILGEYLNVLGKGKLAMDPATLRPSARLIELWSVGETDTALISHGWELKASTGFQFWDCVVLAAALRAECSYLLSDDYEHGRRVDGTTIISPFRATPADHFSKH